jgi:WS/DGAT/MGAT family acyltransferase
VKRATGTTVNDVILAVVAGGMRRWLLARDSELPDELRVFCPVSVREPGERYSLGNRVSGILVDLPLGSMPELTRLARISASTGDLKRSKQAVAAESMTALSEWAPATLHAVGARLASRPELSGQAGLNMVVTNVPGPQVPFYTGGARMLEVWPLVPTYHGVGLTLAVFSYDGRVHFGLNADRDLVPDLERLGHQLEQAAADLVAALQEVRDADGRDADRSRRPSSRPKTRRRARAGEARPRGPAPGGDRPRG